MPPLSVFFSLFQNLSTTSSCINSSVFHLNTQYLAELAKVTILFPFSLSLSLSLLPQLWLPVNSFLFLLQLLGLVSGARALFPLKWKSCSSAHILISMTKGQAWGCGGPPASFLLESAGGRGSQGRAGSQMNYLLCVLVYAHVQAQLQRGLQTVVTKYCARAQVFCGRMTCATQK